MPRVTHLLLRDWIKKEGVARVAALVKTSAISVRHWKNGYVLPNSHQLAKVKIASKGRVSLDRTILHHHSGANKKNRWQSKKSK